VGVKRIKIGSNLIKFANKKWHMLVVKTSPSRFGRGSVVTWENWQSQKKILNQSRKRLARIFIKEENV
jgi:hypothetical protein